MLSATSYDTVPGPAGPGIKNDNVNQILEKKGVKSMCGIMLLTLVLVVMASMRLVGGQPTAIPTISPSSNPTITPSTGSTTSYGFGPTYEPTYGPVSYNSPTSTSTDRPTILSSIPTAQLSTQPKIYGDQSNGYCGDHVANIGDYNGDGYSDFAFTCSYNSAGGNSNTGQIFVIYGGSDTAKSLQYQDLYVSDYSSPNYLGNDGVVINGQTNDYLGNAIDAIGDFNKDSYDDFVVCSTNANSYYGRCYIFFGQSTDDSSYLNFINLEDTYYNSGSYYYIIDAPSLCNFGHSVAGIGDIDNDGFADFAIGAYSFNNDGAVFVIHGGIGIAYAASSKSFISVTNSSNVVMIYGPTYSDMGYSISGGKDLNNDGYPDMAVSARFSGVVFIIHGQSFRRTHFSVSDTNIIDNYAIVRQPSNSYNYGFGTTVLVASDFNGDGFSDLVISDPNQGSNSTKSKVYVMFGGNIQASNFFYLSTDNNNCVLITATSAPDEYIGTALGDAGDMNGDGIADLLISSTAAGTVAYLIDGYEGSANVGYEISLSSATGQAAALQYNSQSSQFTTGNLVGIGDIDGDGYNDAIIGNLNYDSNKGIIFLISESIFYHKPTPSPTHYPTTASAPTSSNCGYIVQNVAGKASSSGHVKSSVYTAGYIKALALDTNGNIYFFDSFNKSIEKYDVTLDEVTTVVDNSVIGGNEDMTLSFDSWSNQLIIAGGKTIHTVGIYGTVNSIAGDPTESKCQYASNNGETTATSTCFYITSYYYDKKNYVHYFFDYYGYSIRKIVNGKVSKVAGNGISCSYNRLQLFDIADNFTMPCYTQRNLLTAVPNSNSGTTVYFIDMYSVLFQVTSTGYVQNVTYADTSSSNTPCSTLDEYIELNGGFKLCQVNSFQYAADQYIYLSTFSMIYKLDATTLAGHAVVGVTSFPVATGFSIYGFALDTANYSSSASTSASFGKVKNVMSIDADSLGVLYIADNTNFIRKVSNGFVSLVIGRLTNGNYTDATLSPLNIPRGIAYSSSEEVLYISDTNSGVIYSVDKSGFRDILAGVEIQKQRYATNDVARNTIIIPNKIAVDSQGNVYFTNSSNGMNYINQVTGSNQAIKTVVGKPYEYSSNNGATFMGLYYDDGRQIQMTGSSLDIAAYEDYLYFSSLITNEYPPSSFIGRLHGGDRSVKIIAGGNRCSENDDNYAFQRCQVNENGHASGAYLRSVPSIATDPLGNIYSYDDRMLVIRKIDASGMISTVGGTGTLVQSNKQYDCMKEGGCAALSVPIYASSLAVDAAQNIYFTWDYTRFGGHNGGAKLMRIDSVTNLLEHVAGSKLSAIYNGNNLEALSANMGYVTSLAYDRVNEAIYFADGTNNIVRKMSCVETSIQFNVTFSLVGVSASSYSASKETNDFVFKLALINSLDNGLKSSDIEITDVVDVTGVTGIVHRVLLGSNGIQVITQFFVIPSSVGYSTGSAAYNGLSSAILTAFTGGSSSPFGNLLSSYAATFGSVLVSASPSTIVLPIISDYTETSYGIQPVKLHYVSLATLLGEAATRETFVKYTTSFTSTILPIMVIIWLVCFTISMFNSEHKTYQGVMFFAISLLSMINTILDSGCMYSNCFDSSSLLYACMVFTWILPTASFMVLTIIDKEIFPFFITEYYIGKVLSKYYRVNILWFWLSHAKGLPLINNKKLKISFDHHDSLPKVVIYIATWLVLIVLQLLTLFPFYLWLMLLSPYYFVVFVLGIFLFQTKLIAHKTVWNIWCFLLSGRSHRYAKNVTYDTVFLNEALLCEALLQATPLLIVKSINLSLIPSDLSNGYSTQIVSAISTWFGFVRFGVLAWWMQYAYNEAPLYFKFKLNGKLVRFGIKRVPLDLKANQEIRDSYLEYWTRYHNECMVDLLYLDTYKIISRVFFRQEDADNATALKREREPLLLALREKELRDISTLQLATETLHFMLRDTVDNKLCKFLKSIDIREPVDLVDITESTIRAICKLMNHYKVRDIVRANLNLLLLYSAKARDALYIQDGESSSKHITDKFGTNAYRQLVFPLVKTDGRLDITIGTDSDGLHITDLSVDSQAYKEGVRSGDRILFINDKSVKTLDAYHTNIEISNKKSRNDHSHNQVRLVIARENLSHNKDGTNTEELFKSFSSASYDWLTRRRRALLPFGSAKVGVVDVMHMDDKSLLQMFRKIDIDGSGTIEEKELQLFLEELHIGGAKTAKTMMELVDLNQDNEISPTEFLQMMKIVQGKADKVTPYSTSIKISDTTEDKPMLYNTSVKDETVEITAYSTSSKPNIGDGGESDSHVDTTPFVASSGKYTTTGGSDETAIDIYNSSVDAQIKLKPKAT